jgi:hypothetical protein
MATDTMTISDYIASKGLKAEFDLLLNGRKDGKDTDYDARARHYNVTITMAGKGTMRGPFTCEYSMGSKADAESIEDVIACLAMDFAGFYNARSFEDWCEEYGYDTDSRRAESIFNAIAAQVVAWDRAFDFAEGSHEASRELAEVDTSDY